MSLHLSINISMDFPRNILTKRLEEKKKKKKTKDLGVPALQKRLSTATNHSGG